MSLRKITFHQFFIDVKNKSPPVYMSTFHTVISHEFTCHLIYSAYISHMSAQKKNFLYSLSSQTFHYITIKRYECLCRHGQCACIAHKVFRKPICYRRGYKTARLFGSSLGHLISHHPIRSHRKMMSVRFRSSDRKYSCIRLFNKPSEFFKRHFCNKVFIHCLTSF